MHDIQYSKTFLLMILELPLINGHIEGLHHLKYKHTVIHVNNQKHVNIVK